MQPTASKWADAAQGPIGSQAFLPAPLSSSQSHKLSTCSVEPPRKCPHDLNIKIYSADKIQRHAKFSPREVFAFFLRDVQQRHYRTVSWLGFKGRLLIDSGVKFGSRSSLWWWNSWAVLWMEWSWAVRYILLFSLCSWETTWLGPVGSSDPGSRTLKCLETCLCVQRPHLYLALHSFKYYLLSTCYVADTVPDTRENKQGTKETVLAPGPLCSGREDR